VCVCVCGRVCVHVCVYMCVCVFCFALVFTYQEEVPAQQEGRVAGVSSPSVLPVRVRAHVLARVLVCVFVPALVL